MNKNDTIFTLNARDNIVLDFTYHDSSPEEIYEEVNGVFDLFIESLETNKIDYAKLKNSLIPNKKRKEIALVFDIDKSGFSLYAYNIFLRLLPLLNKESTHSFLIGDFVGDRSRKKELQALFNKHIIQINPSIYHYHNQYFLIYINNLSENMVHNLIEGLRKYKFFTGYFDVTHSSKIKTYLSVILVPHFIKNNSTLIMPDSSDTLIIDEIEEFPCDYEELGFKCKYIHLTYYHIFLHYKIERKILKRIEKDNRFSLNALSSSFVDLENCKIEIESSKLKHLHKHKTDNLERAGLINLSSKKLRKLLKEKLENNYIYNLTFLKNYDTLKFNVLLEVERKDSNALMKLLVALEYKPKEKILRLITMY